MRIDGRCGLPPFHDPYAAVVAVDLSQEGKYSAMPERAVGLESSDQVGSNEVIFERY
jgi:hypothetical protein